MKGAARRPYCRYMKKLISPVFALALFFGSCHEHGLSHAAPLAQNAAPAKVAGKWQMSMDSPHGVVNGPFRIEQDGAKLTGTFEAEGIGSLAATGTVDGAKVSFSLTVPGGEHDFTFSGTVDGPKMSGKTMMDGVWSATRE